MPSAVLPSTSRRLLLAVSCSWTGDGARTILTSIVRAQDLAVDVLFVEDLDLLQLAALPFTREVGRTSGISREIWPGAVERSLRAAAQQMERDLRRLAQEHRFACTFETRRGRFESEVLRKADAVDVVLLPSRRSSPTTALERARSPQQVIVRVEPDAPAGERALRLAAFLAQPDLRRLVLVLPDPGRHPAAEVLTWARARLPASALPLRTVVESAAHPRPVAALARAGRHDVMVLPADGSRTDDGALDVALATLPCTAVLVR